MSRLTEEDLSQLPETMKYGSLVKKQNISKDDMDILLYKLFAENDDIMLIRSILGSDVKMMEFLDIFAGLNIKIPTHTYIFKVINEIEIWRELVKKGNNQETIKNLSSAYKLSVSKIRMIYDEYENKFGRSDKDEEEQRIQQ